MPRTLVLSTVAALSLTSGFFAPVSAQICPDGPPLPGALGGDLGPTPTGPSTELACLEIRNDAATARTGELAVSGVPLPASLDLRSTDDLVLVGTGDRRVAAQFDVLSRWAGTVDDASRPIRWLQVAAPAEVLAEATSRHSLRIVPGVEPAPDTFAASITADGDDWRIDTGLASFGIDPGNPALIEWIELDFDDDGTGEKTRVYDHVAGAGPRLVVDQDGDPGTVDDLVYDTAIGGSVVLDPGGFEVVESGPVRVVVAARGHFIGGPSLCGATAPAYQSLGFTAVLSFHRASRDVRLRFQLRNECSDSMGGSWTDDTRYFREASWELPLSLTTPTTRVGGDAGLSVSAAGFTGTTEVEQRRGTGTAPDFTDWTRRARARRDGSDLETAAAFDTPFLAVGDASLTVAAQMPWMRFREPQALRVDGTDLSLRFVSDDLRVGEGKGIWNVALLRFLPTDLAPGGDVDAALETLRTAGRLELERGLLAWPGRGAVNASRIFPSLGTGDPHTARTATTAWMDTLHDETVLPGGQWDRNRTYGSQLWPETGPNDPFNVDADFPNQSTAGNNYWDPAGAELIEYLASGDPKWVWDFALPGYWTQAIAAYLNTGENFPGNRNGLSPESGGPGCAPILEAPFVEPCTDDGTGGGHWHRTGGGSDDYTYAMSMELAYALRPDLPMRDRFGQAGQTVLDRYDPATPEANREVFVDAINITRQVIQHFEMLANCAEFVPGPRGLACQERLHGVVAELARDNLASGMFCQGQSDDGPNFNGDILGPPAPLPTQCFSPQQFMTNSLHYPFFHRYWSNYRSSDDPDVQATTEAVRRALVELPRTLVTGGPEAATPPIEQDTDGIPLAFGEWASTLDCTLDAAGTSVLSCAVADFGGPDLMLNQNQPHTLALLLMGHEIDPTLDLCDRVRTAFDDPAMTGAPNEGGTYDVVGHFNTAGWWKGVSQMVQGMAFGLGGYDVCDAGLLFADGFESGDRSAWEP